MLPNPGLQHRLEAFKEEGVTDITDENVEDYIEESEPDMFKAGQEFDHYKKESEEERKALQAKIVKQKYFKENLPNLLTWSEKEQIRFLNLQDSVEWSPEKIAESFPVTAEIVKKLLKYPWKSADEQRIARHDASAMRNWRELKEGTLNISPAFRKHLLKFSNRNLPPTKIKSNKIDLTSTKEMGEFESIVSEVKTESRVKDEGGHLHLIEAGKERESMKYPVNRKRITLDELRSEIHEEMKSGSEISMTDQIILSSEQSISHVANDYEYVPNTQLRTHKAQVSNFKENIETEIQIKSYPDKIQIPKSAWKKGGTYQIQDCFYDDDGQFLYRVPGLPH